MSDTLKAKLSWLKNDHLATSGDFEIAQGKRQTDLLLLFYFIAGNVWFLSHHAFGVSYSIFLPA